MPRDRDENWGRRNSDRWFENFEEKVCKRFDDLQGEVKNLTNEIRGIPGNSDEIGLKGEFQLALQRIKNLENWKKWMIGLMSSVLVVIIIQIIIRLSNQS